jgi:hypothetical protein
MSHFEPMDFDCLTPLGPARCKGVWVEGDVTEWLTDINATREPWWWRNPDFRFGATVSDGSGSPSPFRHPNVCLQRQIKRYQDNGWLPRPDSRQGASS